MAPGLLINESCTNEPSYTGVKYVKTASASSSLLASVQGPLVWRGTDFASSRDYTLNLTQDEVTEIEDALDLFKSLELDGDEVCQSNFLLPALGSKLVACAQEVHSGIGFVNIHGLNPAHYTPEDNIIIFLGVSSYIGGTRGKQDEDGNMLTHIVDAKDSQVATESRPTRYSNKASTFHTDTFCDILALQTRSLAAIGGRHSIASSWAVYNELAASRPDVLQSLASSQWYFDSRSRLISSNKRPLLFHFDDRIILNFAQEPLRGLAGVKRDPNLPSPSKEQIQALNLVETLARKNQLTLDMQPGDLTFINNNAILHTREAFENSSTQVRHLVRMWLRNESLAWRLPKELQAGNMRIYGHNEVAESWNVLPVPKLDFKLSERLCS